MKNIATFKLSRAESSYQLQLFHPQTCVCSNRFLVHESVHDAFIEKLNQAMSSITLGNGMDPGVTQGPLINARAVEKIDGLVRYAMFVKLSYHLHFTILSQSEKNGRYAMER